MTEAQEIWQTCLGADDKIDDLAKAMRDQRVKRREAYDQLKALYHGKTQDELLVIWDENFRGMTEAYYQDESIFPDAFVSTEKYAIPWKIRSTSKRQHFMNRMLGLKRDSNVTAKDIEHDALIRKLEELSHELIIRHDDLSPAQMRNALKCYVKVLDVFHKYHKDDIRNDY